jgi:hypothetical protein
MRTPTDKEPPSSASASSSPLNYEQIAKPPPISLKTTKVGRLGRSNDISLVFVHNTIFTEYGDGEQNNTM